MVMSVPGRVTAPFPNGHRLQALGHLALELVEGAVLKDHHGSRSRAAR